MKIAHLISTFPPHKGGMGLVCQDEVSRLAPENEVAVYTLAYPGYKYEDEKLSYKVFRLKPFIKIGDGGILSGLTELLRGYDIILFTARSVRSSKPKKCSALNWLSHITWTRNAPDY